MTHGVERHGPWRQGLSRWVLIAMICLAPLAFWSLKQIHLENDIQNWLPVDNPQAKTLHWYFDHFPHEDHILVSWDGSSLSDPRVARFVERLAGTADENGVHHDGLKQIRSVVTLQNVVAQMVESGVEPKEAVRRLKGVLIGTGPRAPVALFVALSDAGTSDKPGTLRAIRRVAEQIGIDRDKFHLGGQIVAGTELNHAVAQAAWNRDVPVFQFHKHSVLLLSGLVGIGLTFLVLRSLRLATLVLLVALYTTLLAVALVPVTGGSLNMVVVVMPSLLMVLTISGAIHVANYWKHAAHNNPRNAAAEAMKLAKLPCLLASATTAIGLLSLTTSPLAPVSDFGFYSAIGCLVSLSMVLFGLPVLLQLWPPRPPRELEVEAAGWRGLGRWLSQHSVSVTLVSMVLFVVATSGLRWFRTETKVIRNFSEESRVVQDYRFLEQNLGGLIPFEMVVRFDTDAQSETDFLQRMELVRAIEDKLRQHAEISGTLSLADFLPVSDRVPEEAGRMAKLMVNKRANETEKRIKTEGRSGARAFLTVSNTATDLNRDGDAALSKVGDELWRITAQVAIMTDLDFHDLIDDLHQIARLVLRDLPGAGHVVTGMVPLFERTQ